MNLLATLWSPSLDPIGRSSIIAIVTGIIAWLVIDLPVLRGLRPFSIYGSLAIISSLLFFSAAPVMLFLPLMLLSSTRYFPNCDDYFGNHVLMSVGLVIAFRCYQVKPKTGAVVLGLFGLMVLLQLVQMLVLRFG